ncbi:MAG: TolC family protein [Bacteroidetes bacterium]|nr:TolC family protein [Bacteroidota bacterium]
MNKKMTIRTIIAAILLAAPVSFATAQSTRDITLNEAIKIGLQNSKQLKLSDARVREATYQLRDARGRMLPDLSVSGSYLRVSQPTIDLKLKTGNQTNGEQSSNAASNIKVNEAAYGIANLSFPVFAGLKIHYGIESAKYLQKAAQLDADKDREEVIQNIVNAYSTLYKARVAVELVKENLRGAQQRVKDFTNLEKNGVIARNDLLKAELQQSNVELSLLDAQSNLKVTNTNINLMLGLPEDTQLIPDSSSFIQVQDAGSINDWESKALQNRKDVAALAMREKAANANIKIAKGDYYPSLALTGGYVAADIPNFVTITNALNAGVGVKYSPSSLWKAGTKVAEARTQKAELMINEDMLNDQVRIQVTKAYEDYLLSNQKITVYDKAVDQATENYRITKNKYDNSLATTTDLLDADVAQLQAQLNYISARVDASVAYNRLLQSAGLLNENIK